VGDRTAGYRYRSLFNTKCHQVSREENRHCCIRCRVDPGSDPDRVLGLAAFVESYCRNHDALCRDCVCVGETKAGNKNGGASQDLTFHALLWTRMATESVSSSSPMKS